MATSNLELPVVVIVGPTASGKTAAAIQLAKSIQGEIICADSRTIYRGMDIGTAKPGLVEQDGVVHFGLDLVDPGERFTAADFKQYALQKITQIHDRNHVPIIVGGTGLYVDGVVLDYQFGGTSDQVIRAELEAMTLDKLHEYCERHSIQLPKNRNNKRYVIRAIEQNGVNHKRKGRPNNNFIVVGINTDRHVLRKRIEVRSHTMFSQNVVNEASSLADQFGWGSEAMTANIYRIIKRLLDGEITQSQAEDLFVTSDMRLAKRQMTWFKRRDYIRWFDDAAQLKLYCQTEITLRFRANTDLIQ